MKWNIKIENKPEYRIEVQFDPLKEVLRFSGQFKSKNDWLTFNIKECSMNIDLDKITEILFETYEILNNRVLSYKNISEGFEYIKVIEITEN